MKWLGEQSWGNIIIVLSKNQPVRTIWSDFPKVDKAGVDGVEAKSRHNSARDSGTEVSLDKCQIINTNQRHHHQHCHHHHHHHRHYKGEWERGRGGWGGAGDWWESACRTDCHHIEVTTGITDNLENTLQWTIWTIDINDIYFSEKSAPTFFYLKIQTLRMVRITDIADYRYSISWSFCRFLLLWTSKQSNKQSYIGNI